MDDNENKQSRRQRARIRDRQQMAVYREEIVNLQKQIMDLKTSLTQQKEEVGIEVQENKELALLNNSLMNRIRNNEKEAEDRNFKIFRLLRRDELQQELVRLNFASNVTRMAHKEMFDNLLCQIQNKIDASNFWNGRETSTRGWHPHDSCLNIMPFLRSDVQGEKPPLNKNLSESTFKNDELMKKTSFSAYSEEMSHDIDSQCFSSEVSCKTNFGATERIVEEQSYVFSTQVADLKEDFNWSKSYSSENKVFLLVDALNEAFEKCKRLEDELRRTEEELEITRKDHGFRMTQMNQEIVCLQDRLLKANNDRVTFENNYQLLRNEIKKMMIEKSVMYQSLMTERELHGEEAASCQSLVDAVESMKAQIDELMQNNKQLGIDKERLASECDKKDSRMECLNKRIEALQEQVESQDEMLEKYREKSDRKNSGRKLKFWN